MKRFSIYRQDDEKLEFFVGDKKVGSVNHDGHGWVGMDAAEQLFFAIAAKLDAEVHEIGEPEDSDNG